MLTRRRIAIYAVFALALAAALSMGLSQAGAAYPGPGEAEGWTAESTAGFPGVRHAQVAASDGYVHLAADDGSDVKVYRCDEGGGLAWNSGTTLDYDSANTACDPYIAASGQHVVVSWKEIMDGRWAHVFAFSYNWGNTWIKTYDLCAANNYEAHVHYGGERIHAAYVSDATGRNEVWYKRFRLDRVLETCTCATDSGDGVAATTPCIEAPNASEASIYYSRDDGANDTICQAHTSDSGVSWSQNVIMPAGGLTAMWPECAVFWVGGSRRVLLVADFEDITTHAHQARYARWDGSSWNPDSEWLCDGDINEHLYPQVASRGDDLLITYRQTGGSAGREGAARINLNAGEGTWKFVDDLFHENLPYDHPGCIDCCSDEGLFYACQAGTGDHPEVMAKREDKRDPTVAMKDPGKYHRGSFSVGATASDDFDRDGAFMLGREPYNQPYEGGIPYAVFEYRYQGGDWRQLSVDKYSPWGAGFEVAGRDDGEYDFRVTVYDTSSRQSTAYWGGDGPEDGVIVDRAPPTGVELQVSPPDGDNGWYRSQPAAGPVVTAVDTVSGVKALYYRFDGEADWTVYSQPFQLREGCHDVHYYAEDRAGNASDPSTFSYRADFTDPEVEITSPDPGRYFRVEMEAEASCGDAGSGVEGVTWLVDGNPVAQSQCGRATLDISGLVDGQHQLRAEARDAAGRTCRGEPVVFYKDVTPPTVEVVEPSGENWVRGMVTIKADIRDNLKVGRAEFLVDGEVVDERTSAPWMAAWDTSTVKNGYHAVRVRAWDAAGNGAEVTASGETTLYVGNNISETNHFAEGCTRSGFDTWLCLQNPGEERADVTVNYYLGEGQGSASARTYSLPPHSRSTVYVNGDVGADKDVSIQVTSSKPIVSERPMYFDYGGTASHGWQGCHTAQGAHFPREDWYFAEGCTRSGFETWLCLQNPEGREAVVEVEYMMEGGATADRTYRVAPWSRGTVLVNREVGEGHDVSMRVTSSVPVVAERPVYFLYQGMWDGGHNVMGAAQPESEWYFAEGCTRTGFNQWICLMNPHDEATTAKLVYVMEDGGRIEREYGLGPRSRFTVNVNNDVARQHDVSTFISSGKPIVVERPMYFLYNSSIDEGSNAMGVCRPGSSWYLAEGCTREGFEEWICLMNPGEEEAEVILRFMLEDSSVREHVVSIPPATRVTVKVNDVVGPGHDVSTEVMSDKPVIVERPMYSIYRGSCPSGDTLSGYTFNP
ncbi:MAG: Ig-like domain-containing protein [Actinomycetota bacterium]|nr:Ig-like domain-containing protein [Actinomycetota bacterium]